jgi:hypothetical protein
VNAEVLQQRLRDRTRQQQPLPQCIEHERQPGDRDRDRDAPPEPEAATPRDQSDRLLRAIQRVVHDEREVLACFGHCTRSLFRGDGALLPAGFEPRSSATIEKSTISSV